MVSRDIVSYAASRRAPVRKKLSSAPTGALAGPSWIVPNYPQQESWNSQSSINIAYCQCSYIYRAATLIADVIAGLPFRASTSPMAKDHNPNSKLAKLLGPAQGGLNIQQGPNPMWSSAQFWRYTIVQRIITGKYAWRYGRDADGNIAQLWPLMAQYIEPVPNRNPAIPSYFGGLDGKAYWYFPQGHQSHEKFRLEDIFYGYRKSQKDVRQSESVLEAMALDIKTFLLLGQYDEAFLANGGMPSYIVTTPQFATTDQREAWREQFAGRFSGVRNTGKAIFAERSISGDFGTGSAQPSDNVDIKVLGTTQKDAQLDLLRKAKIDDILNALGVPMSLISDSSDRTFSNAAAENRNFMQTVIRPLICDLQDEVNNQLAPLFGDELGYFDISEVPALKPVPVFTEDAGLKLVQSHLITRDEFRVDHGLPISSLVKDTDYNGKIVSLDTIPVGAPMVSRLSESENLYPSEGGGPSDKLGTEKPNALPPSVPSPTPIPPIPLRSYRALTFKAHSGACELCIEADGLEDPNFDGYDLPHPNCMCSVEVSNPTERSVISLRDVKRYRHRGKDGHHPVPSGHESAKDTLERVLSAQLNLFMDEQATQAQARLNGRRGRQVAKLAAASPGAVWDQEASAQRAREMLGPVLGEMGRDVDEYVMQLIADITNKLAVVYSSGVSEESIAAMFKPEVLI